ncbi:MAG: hypothetical protein K2V38_16215 [Gemmataceae bacterium]|nr:hypothetical protein [Gemmataceae bacterium]
MKWALCGVVAVALVVGAPATAGDIEFRPVDTNKLVVKPSKAAANLAAGTINLAGQTAANSLENNGYIKTLNNLFGVKKTEPRFQAGPSMLPSPNVFKSTQYTNYNTPAMPIQVPRR